MTTAERTEPSEVRPKTSLPATVALVTITVGLCAYLYARAFQWWYFEWTYSGTYYAHAIFIPFLVAAMLWKDRERLRRLPVGRCWWGTVLILLSAAMVVHAYRADITVSLSISFLLFLIGAAMLIVGWQFTRAILLPIVFLLAMIPIVPNSAINQVAFPAQVISARFATAALKLMGFAAQRIGTQIQMDAYNLNVELPCSGFKTLLGLVAFAGAFAYLVDGARWKKWTIFAIAAPLSLAVNGVRITLIGLVGEMVGSGAAARFHDYSGLIVLIIGFFVLFSLAQWLACDSFMGMPLKSPGKGAPIPTPEEASAAARDEAEHRYGPPRTDTLAKLNPGLIPVIVLLAASCTVRATVKPQVSTYPVMPPSAVPHALSGWQQLGMDIPITQTVKETLQPETYLDRIYTATPPSIGTINLFITGGSTRHTFHDPHDCFTGSGYVFRDTQVIRVQTAAGPVDVQEAEAENPKDHTTSLLMFVFIVDGKTYRTMADVHAAILRQTFLGSSGRPFYFIRFRQLAAGTDNARRQEMLSFVRQLWSVIGPKVTAPR